MKKYSLFVVSLALVLFAGCGGTTPAPVEKPVPTPAWVNSTLPSDTPTKMYGMAIDTNRESAIKSALSDMVSRLGITISSSFENTQKVESSYVKSIQESKIKADISRIKINNYVVIQSHKLSYKEYAVMIESDKQQFMSGLKEDLELQKKSISQKAAALKGSDAITQYNEKKLLSQEAQNLTSVILILAQLDKSFDKDANMKFVASHQQEYISATKKLKFYVSGDKKSKPFVDKIKNYLAQKSFNVVNSKTDAININVSTSDNVESMSGGIAVLNIDVAVYDASKRVGGNSLTIKERYNTTHSSIYEKASIHFEEDIKTQGINEAIGINLNI